MYSFRILLFSLLLLLVPLSAAGAEGCVPTRIATTENPMDPAARKRARSHFGDDNPAGPDVMPRQARRDSHLSGNMPTVFGGDTQGAFRYIASQEGIDVSHYQGSIDWQRVVHEGGISYVYVKATEGAAYYDDTHAFNLSMARKYKLKVGSYHFYRPTVDVREQLQNLFTHVIPGEQDLVPMIDIEDARGVSEDRFIADLTTFLRQVERHYGKKPLLYTGEYFYNHHFCGLFQGFQWMIARYSTTPPTLRDGRRYVMWQYSDKGRIPGVPSLVDRSCIIGNGNLKALKM